jgi:hypothetical protein
MNIVVKMNKVIKKFKNQLQRPYLAGATLAFNLGTIEKPPGVEKFEGTEGEIGVLNFFSVLLQVATILAGLFVLLNIVLAGYTYITSQGDSSSHEKVRLAITNSIIGLIIISVAYTIVAALGLILFGSADYFFNPQLGL